MTMNALNLKNEENFNQSIGLKTAGGDFDTCPV